MPEAVLKADITGFLFLDGETEFTPSQELENFLKDGEPPIYIG